MSDTRPIPAAALLPCLVLFACAELPPIEAGDITLNATVRIVYEVRGLAGEGDG